MNRSGWIALAALIAAFLLLASVALVKFMVEEPPDEASAERIQARFAEQLAILTELAASHPGDACAISPESLQEEREQLAPWFERIEQSRDRFDSAEILGAEVVYDCGESTRGFPVKTFDAGTFSWSKPRTSARPTWPSVSLWHSPDGRFVRYEDRPSDGHGAVIQLTLDLAEPAP